MAYKLPAWLTSVLRLAATAIVFTLIIRQIDTGKLLQQLSHLSPWDLIAAFALIFFQFLANVFRWKIVLEALQRPFSGWVALRIMMVAQFFGQVMPSSIGGDVLRVWYARQEGFSTGAALSSVILERVGGLITIALMVLITLPFLTSTVTDPTKRFGLILCMALILVGVLTLFLLERLPVGLQRLRPIRFASDLGRQAWVLFVNPRLRYRIFGISALGQIALSLAIWLLVVDLGEQVSLLTCLLVVPPALLMTAIPITISGWGVREGALIIGLGLGGVSSETAVAASLVFGLLTMAFGLPGGLLWLRQRPHGAPPNLHQEMPPWFRRNHNSPGNDKKDQAALL